MDEPAFRTLANAELQALARALDGLGDLTVDLANDILTIEFDDGDKFVANMQGPTRQIWFAASYRAGHFNFDEDGKIWRDDKTGEPLRARIARDVSAKLGRKTAL